MILDPTTLSVAEAVVFLTTGATFIFGTVLIVMMRFRPEGLLPARRMKHELHTTNSEHA